MGQIIWMIVSVVVSVAVQLMFSKGQKNRVVAEDIDAPNVDYGVPYKIVLGTRDVKPTYAWFGNTDKKAIKK